MEHSEQKAARTACLAAAETALRDANQHAQALERAGETERSKRLEMERAQEKLTAMRCAIAEEKEASAAFSLARADRAQKDECFRATAAILADRSKEFQEASRTAETASEILRAAHRRQASIAAMERRAELSARLTQAEHLRVMVETAAAEAASGPSESVVIRLEALFEDVKIARKSRDSQAAALTMRYADGERTASPHKAYPSSTVAACSSRMVPPWKSRASDG